MNHIHVFYKAYLKYLMLSYTFQCDWNSETDYIRGSFKKLMANLVDQGSQLLVTNQEPRL